MIELLLDWLAVYRLTRLATEDSITLPLRGRLIKAAYDLRDGADEDDTDPRVPWKVWENSAIEDGDQAPKLAELITCRWCASVWVAAGCAVFRAVAPRTWGRVRTVLAASAAGTLIAGLER